MLHRIILRLQVQDIYITVILILAEMYPLLHREYTVAIQIIREQCTLKKPEVYRIIQRVVTL